MGRAAAGGGISQIERAGLYDVENCLAKAMAVGGTNYYYYNAAGQRARRVVQGAETWLVYGFEGELVAEYPVSGTFNGSNPATVAQREYGYRNGQLRWVVALRCAGWWRIS